MRLRRGNYMILFAFLFPLLIGFMALAIDIGRMRVAAIQAEGAADAAALAALVELRDGGSRSDALTAARTAADQIRTQRIGKDDATPGSEFNVELSYGDWAWDTSSWNTRERSINSVTVNVEQRDPLWLLFAPIFQLGGSRGNGVYSGGNYKNIDDAKKTVRVGRRASMRPRDVVVVVDISRKMFDHHKDLQTELSTFVETAASFDIDLDRMAVVVYAGDSDVLENFEALNDNESFLRSAMFDTDPCSVSDEAWYFYYRHFDTDYDREIAVNGTVPQAQMFNYNVVWANASMGDEARFPNSHLQYDSIMASFLLADSATGGMNMGTLAWESEMLAIDPTWEPYNDSNWNTRELLPEEQCKAWQASWVAFTGCDPRTRPACDPTAFDTYPGLECHEGGYWEGRVDRFATDLKAPEVDCTSLGYPNMDFGGEAYQVDADGIFGFEHADQSYQFAGSNPGAGLKAAADLLQAQQPSRGEPTVVLVTSSGPACGPNLQEHLVDNCEDDFYDDIDVALTQLDGLNAVVHVLAISDDPVENDILSGLTLGRGQFMSSEDAEGLAEGLDDVARDIKLQVVE